MPYCIDCGNWFEFFVGGSNEYCLDCHVNGSEEVYHVTLTKCAWCEMLFETIDPDETYCARCKTFLKVHNYGPYG